MLREYSVNVCFNGDVTLVKVWSFAADKLNTIDYFLGGVVEVVNDNDLVIRFKKSKSGEGADVTSATMLSQSHEFEPSPVREGMLHCILEQTMVCLYHRNAIASLERCYCGAPLTRRQERIRQA